jgi:hypothetical protein
VKDWPAGGCAWPDRGSAPPRPPGAGSRLPDATPRTRFGASQSRSPCSASAESDAACARWQKPLKHLPRSSQLPPWPIVPVDQELRPEPGPAKAERETARTHEQLHASKGGARSGPSRWHPAESTAAVRWNTRSCGRLRLERVLPHRPFDLNRLSRLSPVAGAGFEPATSGL